MIEILLYVYVGVSLIFYGMAMNDWMTFKNPTYIADTVMIWTWPISIPLSWVSNYAFNYSIFRKMEDMDRWIMERLNALYRAVKRLNE